MSTIVGYSYKPNHKSAEKAEDIIKRGIEAVKPRSVMESTLDIFFRGRKEDITRVLGEGRTWIKRLEENEEGLVHVNVTFKGGEENKRDLQKAMVVGGFVEHNGAKGDGIDVSVVPVLITAEPVLTMLRSSSKSPIVGDVADAKISMRDRAKEMVDDLTKSQYHRLENYLPLFELLRNDSALYLVKSVKKSERDEPEVSYLMVKHKNGVKNEKPVGITQKELEAAFVDNLKIPKEAKVQQRVQ